jgi:hypothetical protein
VAKIEALEKIKLKLKDPEAIKKVDDTIEQIKAANQPK